MALLLQVRMAGSWLLSWLWERQNAAGLQVSYYGMLLAPSSRSLGGLMRGAAYMLPRQLFIGQSGGQCGWAPCLAPAADQAVLGGLLLDLPAVGRPLDMGDL